MTKEEKAALKAAEAAGDMLGDEVAEADDIGIAGDVSAKKSDKVTAAVLGKGGEVIREYSKAVHGKDFKALANEFASKVEGRKVA